MTTNDLAVNRVLGLKRSMTVLLLLAYGTAALAAGVGWGKAFSGMFAPPNGADDAAMELEPSALFAQGLEP